MNGFPHKGDNFISSENDAVNKLKTREPICRLVQSHKRSADAKPSLLHNLAAECKLEESIHPRKCARGR